jgi:hypothetical protein
MEEFCVETFHRWYQSPRSSGTFIASSLLTFVFRWRGLVNVVNKVFVYGVRTVHESTRVNEEMRRCWHLRDEFGSLKGNMGEVFSP